MAELTLEDVMAAVEALRRDLQAQIADLTAQVNALKTVTQGANRKGYRRKNW